MNFRPDLAEAVMAGRKTCTRRLVSDNPKSPWWREKCAYRVGQEVAICPGRGKHNIGKARVTSVARMALGRVDDAEAKREGFPNWERFYIAWSVINGSYDADALVWRIGLEAVRDA
jgi:hypothetical protein